MASRKTTGGGGVGETIKTIVYAVVIALFIRTLFYEPFSIPSASMVPTLLVGDYLFVSKFTYGYSHVSLPFGLPLFSGRIAQLSQPQRGDVVVFKLPCQYPQLDPATAAVYGARCDNSVDFIKRVIGLPGDKIQMKDGILNINGQPVKRERIEPYFYTDEGRATPFTQYIETLPNGYQHRIIEIGDNQPLDNTREFSVPAGTYFMMGDNRDDSADSRDPTSGVGFVPADEIVGKAQFIFFSTDGYARWWEFWKWPFTIRYGRLLSGIH
jgi:signal peptidase I